jgi:O-methyltransferase domain/Dimerisation domain
VPSANDAVDRLHVLQMITGYWLSQTIYVAARLRLADALADGPRSVMSLSRELEVDRDALRRLLRALAGAGLLTGDGAGGFALTSRGHLLRERHAGSLCGLALSLGDLPYRAWAGLETSVRTGRPAFADAHGSSYFDYLDAHPEHAELFDQSMANQSRLTREIVAAAHDFSRFRRIVDVGGGRGGLLSEIVSRWPGVRGIVFDRPAVAERHAGADLGLEWVGGDFFVGPLPDADAYLLSLVLHDWDDGDALRLLTSVARSMRRDSRLFVIESIVPADDSPSFAKLLDLHMLVCFGGRERTEAEYRELLERAGLSALAIHPAFGPTSRLSLIECSLAPDGPR